MNDIKFDGATIHLEPDSVILRDPAGNPLQIVEQNYRNDPVTGQLLLSLFERKEIEFYIRETKQVEFVRASGVKSEVVYVHDGVSIDWNRWRGDIGNRRTNEEFGSKSQTKVAVMREFKNTKANGLGIPLPKGRVRFYRSNAAQIEFTGENQIDHTPADELVKIYTADAFDLVGERKRTNFKADNSNHSAEESFEITLRNRKKDPVTVRVVEHLLRWNNWEITEKSDTFLKLNSDQIEFRIELKPDEARKVTYKVHYSW